MSGIRNRNRRQPYLLRRSSLAAWPPPNSAGHKDGTRRKEGRALALQSLCPSNELVLLWRDFARASSVLPIYQADEIHRGSGALHRLLHAVVDVRRLLRNFLPDLIYGQMEEGGGTGRSGSIAIDTHLRSWKVEWGPQFSRQGLNL